MIAITGNTYPVRDQLKALGGKWDKDRKAWMVPDAKAAEARKLVEGAPKSEPLGYYTKLEDGTWGVRCEATLAAGATVKVRTKAGAIKEETIEALVRPGVYRVVRRVRKYECEECGEWVEPGTSCWETGMTH